MYLNVYNIVTVRIASENDAENIEGSPQRNENVEPMEIDTEPEPNANAQISDNETNEPEIIEKSDNDLFNTETLVAENDLVKVYIIKDYFKRQKIFRY